MTLISESSAHQSRGRSLRSGTVQYIAGGLVLFLVVFATLQAPSLTQWDPLGIDILEASQPPSFASGHVLGTDELGRDVLSRILYGGRLAIGISAAGALSGALFGCVLAFASTLGGKTTDHLVPRLADAQLAMPNLILAIILSAFFGPTPLVLGSIVLLATWVLPFRIARASFKTTLAQPYVEASRMAGLSHLAIARHHLFPVLLPQLAVTLSIGFSTALVLVSSLGYLGLGPQPPAPDWGRMVAEAQGQIGLAWWASIFPGLAIVLTLTASQLLGDGLARRLSLSATSEVET